MTTPLERHKPAMLDPANVMLTGPTGYVGAFLLRSLLQDTTADVHCLVRAESEQHGRERIESTLRGYASWEDAFASRIRPVLGDLGKPLLGLTPARFTELATVLDAIYHNGALVNFAYPYSLLKGPNVQGTQEVVRLACQVRPKALHHMGTIDSLVATHAARPWLEIDPPKEPRRDAPDGYMLSKWVAENLVIAARDRGVPVTIFRPAWVIGHTRTGASAKNNFLLLQLRCYLQLGLLPENPWSEPYNGVPVDYLGRAVVHLSRQEGSLGKTFQPWGGVHVDFDQIYAWIADFGYDFDVVPRRQLVTRLRELEPSDPVYALVPLMERMFADLDQHTEPPTYDPRIECTNAIAGLAGSGIEPPAPSRELVHGVLSYLVETGFLEAPVRS